MDKTKHERFSTQWFIVRNGAVQGCRSTYEAALEYATALARHEPRVTIERHIAHHDLPRSVTDKHRIGWSGSWERTHVETIEGPHDAADRAKRGW